MRWVVWSGNGKAVRAGQVGAMKGHRPVITIVTRDPAAVTKEQVATARAVAKEHQGVYAGVVRANWWKRPRIVAAYIDPSG